MPKRYGSPNMSDTTLLVSVEDLINMALGPADVNVVNFKMIQTVLHILARQLRMLETQVEIRVQEAPPPREKKEKKPKQPAPSSPDSSSPKASPPKSPMKGIKEETVRPSREREKETRTAAKYQEKAEKSALKDKEKAERAQSKEREKAERAESKEREKAAKEKEKEEKMSAKEREKAAKEKEKEEKMSAKEREKAAKEKEKEEKMSAKEREKAAKEKEKEEKMSAKEREKAEKDKEKLEKMTAKEREKAEKEKAKAEEAALKDKEKAERSQSKEREKAERAESKERVKAERAESKEREKAERASSKERENAEKAAAKEKEKAEKEKAKELERAEQAALKEKERAERAESREREKSVKIALKEKEAAERAESRERDKHLKAAVETKEKTEREESRMREKQMRAESKEREKAERAEAKEKEKAERAESKERERAEKEESRGRAKTAKAESKEKEKAERAESKEREKDEKSAQKEKEKMEKADAKDKEKALKEHKSEKIDTKDKEKAGKEKGKSEKMDAKDKEEAENEAAAKEKEKVDKMSAKERKEYEKEKAKEEKGRGKTGGKAGISIKEKDKVLIVEKGPTTRTDSRTKVGSIEVVTLSQFELLEATVKDLKLKAGPLPFPAMPDNEKLRRDLSKGSASLTDTMQAMQVAARVQAAELAIGRMAGLLTQLAAAGALPEDVAGKLDDVKAEMDAVVEESAKAQQAAEARPRKSVAIDPLSKKTSVMSKVEGARPSAVGARPSVSSRPSTTSRVSLGGAGVTHVELDNAVRSLKDDLTKNVNLLTAKATAAAEGAAATAKAVSDKLDIALKLNTRINTLYSLVTDYAEQLSGFDAGLTTQMQSFQEQMAQMRSDLKGGITLLDSANNNAETAAVTELTERYEGLVSELDATLHAHTALTAFQKQLADELHSLLECVEMLREQKADRDEVQDGLRDKADNSRLAGLLTEADFASSRSELERRLDLCYDKFRKQEQVWMGAIRDLTRTAEGKADIMQLLAARDDAQQQLRDIQLRLQQLAAILGEPKAAMLTRQISVGARCGACLVPALQEPQDANAGQPPLLPAARPKPQVEPCTPDWRPAPPPEAREHTCHRWVGGSHTLLGESTVREQAGPLQALGPPTKRYTGYGSDGRLYMMEEELQPCVECNLISTDLEKLAEEKQPEPVAQADGGGDTGLKQTTMELPDPEPKT